MGCYPKIYSYIHSSTIKYILIYPIYIYIPKYTSLKKYSKKMRTIKLLALSLRWSPKSPAPGFLCPEPSSSGTLSFHLHFMLNVMDFQLVGFYTSRIYIYIHIIYTYISTSERYIHLHFPISIPLRKTLPRHSFTFHDVVLCNEMSCTEPLVVMACYGHLLEIWLHVSNGIFAVETTFLLPHFVDVKRSPPREIYRGSDLRII